MNIMETKSFSFAKRIVKLYSYLRDNNRSYGLGDQVLRSGTSIGANISEGTYGQSKSDFIHKYQIALKEANETKYWLRLLRDCDYVPSDAVNDLITECDDIIKMLTASINTAKKNLSGN